jgi:hypothetical protein
VELLHILKAATHNNTHSKSTIVAVTKLYASRSQQICAVLQHEQMCPGELNVLQEFSFQPAVTFSFVTGSMRYFDYCILHLSVNLTVHLNAFAMAFYYFNKLKFFPLFQIILRCVGLNLRSMHRTTYILAMKCS